MSDNETKTILVIDDDELVLEVTAGLLENLGYTPLISNSADQAFKIFESEGDHIDLIITDLSMPKTTGPELILRIRKLDQQIPILISSGYIEYNHPIPLEQLKISGMIKKPFTSDELSKKIIGALKVK